MPKCVFMSDTLLLSIFCGRLSSEIVNKLKKEVSCVRNALVKFCVQSLYHYTCLSRPDDLKAHFIKLVVTSISEIYEVAECNSDI